MISGPAVEWMEVGEPPATIGQEAAERMRRMLPAFSLLGGFLFGGLAGWAAIVLWPGATSWSFPRTDELFLAVGIPVGVADFFATRWMVPWLAAQSLLHVRRLSVFGGQLRVEPTTGTSFEVPVRQVRVSESPVVDGWYSVRIVDGKVSPAFYVPGSVAVRLAEALRSHP
jgi:hypothetical protein